MKTILALALVLAIVSASSIEDEKRMKEVERLNSLPGMTWVAGISPNFAGKPLGFSKSLLGVKGGKKANKAILQAAEEAGKLVRMPPLTPEQIAAIPTSFDSAVNWPKCAHMINNIRDQSNCGCCWAFGAAEAASDRLCIANNGTLIVPLSVEEMCFCSSSDGCDGGDTFTPWMYIQYNGLASGADQGNGTYDNMGFCSKFSLPHCHHHGPIRNDPYPPEGSPGCPSQSSPACPTSCDPSAKAPHNNFQTDRYTFQGTVVSYSDVASIQQAIMQDGPVEAAFTVYSDFENYVSGIYQYTSGDELGGHAIKITGWGVENNVPYWKVANSWNPFWGENGYFRIIRGTDNCGIEDDITASSPGATWARKTA